MFSAHDLTEYTHIFLNETNNYQNYKSTLQGSNCF
jgi:hypothetical protein